MDALTLRSQHDIELYDQLLKDTDVIKMNEVIAKQVEQGNLGVRRHLLSTSVRLNRIMAPELHATADMCREKLDLDIPLELYVFPSPSFNAACVKPEAGRLFVMFSSSLLESFTEAEIRFVMGHELGHHLYGHHDIPIGYIMRGKSRPNPRLALTLTSWSRYAEISADRAGAHCAQDFEAVSRALFKLASGLSGKFIQFSLEDFLRQVDDMHILDSEPGEGSPKEDWFSTHPFSPLRVKALQLFDESILARPGGTNADDLEVGVQRLMSLMEPNYMEGRTEIAESMRRLLFSGALMVANADGNISEEEIAVFEKFFGKGAFTDSLNLQSIADDLSDRIAQVNKMASVPQCMQVLRDICIVAKAEGDLHEQELEMLYTLARGLKIPTAFIDQTLNSDTDLD